APGFSDLALLEHLPLLDLQSTITVPWKKGRRAEADFLCDLGINAEGARHDERFRRTDRIRKSAAVPQNLAAGKGPPRLDRLALPSRMRNSADRIGRPSGGNGRRNACAPSGGFAAGGQFPVAPRPRGGNAGTVHGAA